MRALPALWWLLQLAFDLTLAALFAAIGCAGVFAGIRLQLFVTAPPLWSVGQYVVAWAVIVCLPFGMLGVYGLLACLSSIHRKFRS